MQTKNKGPYYWFHPDEGFFRTEESTKPTLLKNGYDDRLRVATKEEYEDSLPHRFLMIGESGTGTLYKLSTWLDEMKFKYVILFLPDVFTRESVERQNIAETDILILDGIDKCSIGVLEGVSILLDRARDQKVQSIAITSDSTFNIQKPELMLASFHAVKKVLEVVVPKPSEKKPFSLVKLEEYQKLFTDTFNSFVANGHVPTFVNSIKLYNKMYKKDIADRDKERQVRFKFFAEESRFTTIEQIERSLNASSSANDVKQMTEKIHLAVNAKTLILEYS